MLVERARKRGELRDDVSTDLATSLVGGPLFLYYLALVAEAHVALPANPAGVLAKIMREGIGRRR